jgi:hypothetical protein
MDDLRGGTVQSFILPGLSAGFPNSGIPNLPKSGSEKLFHPVMRSFSGSGKVSRNGAANY